MQADDIGLGNQRVESGVGGLQRLLYFPSGAMSLRVEDATVKPGQPSCDLLTGGAKADQRTRIIIRIALKIAMQATLACSYG